MLASAPVLSVGNVGELSGGHYSPSWRTIGPQNLSDLLSEVAVVEQARVEKAEAL